MDVITGGGAAVTVSVVVPLIAPSVAVMVVDPAATAVARPAALMVAVAVEELAQVTEAVRFCVDPSLYNPVALNCCVAPAAMDGEAGVIEIEERVGAAGVTVSMAVPLTPLMVAVSVVDPAPAAVARPAALTVATLVEELLQFAVEVTSPVEPSDHVPVALNCCVAPGAIVAVEGETAMLASAGGFVEPLPEPEEPALLLDPHPAAARAMRAAAATANEAGRIRRGRCRVTARYSKVAISEFVERYAQHRVSAGPGRTAKMREECR
jgi:hypothetical protein